MKFLNNLLDKLLNPVDNYLNSLSVKAQVIVTMCIILLPFVILGIIAYMADREKDKG